MTGEDVARVNEILSGVAGEKRIKCSISPVKGRILIAVQDFHTGDVLFNEKSLREVVTPQENDLYDKICEQAQIEEWDLDPIWYWCAVSSVVSDLDESSLRGMAEESVKEESICCVLERFLALPIPRVSSQVREQLNMFFAPVSRTSDEVRSLSQLIAQQCGIDELKAKTSAGKKAVGFLHGLIEPRKMEVYLKTWVLNCFECQDDPLAFGTYFTPTFCSHSCMPNTVWHLTHDGTYSLVARCNINEGEELSLSYLGDADLMNTTLERQEELKTTKGFVCTCPRCANATDLSRGFRCKVCNRGQWFMANTREWPRGVAGEMAKDWRRGFRDEKQWLVESGPIFLSVTSHINWELSDLKSPKLTEESMRKWLERFTPEECVTCAAKPSEDEIFEMLAIEGWLQKVYGARNEKSNREIGEAAEVAMQHMGQHEILIKLLGERAAFWSPIDTLLSLQLNARRVDIYRTVTPMLCGTVAWAQNDVFRSSLSLHGFPTNPEPEGKVPLTVCEDLIMDDEAWKACFESLRLISVLFGRDNDYFSEPAEFASAILHPLSSAIRSSSRLLDEKVTLRQRFFRILDQAEQQHVISHEEVMALLE